MDLWIKAIHMIERLQHRTLYKYQKYSISMILNRFALTNPEEEKKLRRVRIVF